MNNHKSGFAGVAIIIILALGALGFGTYKLFYKATPAVEEMHISEGTFPEGYKPATHTTSKEMPVIATDTSDWKTYKNEKYGFAITYPEGAKINEIDISSGESIEFTTTQGHLSIDVVSKAWYNGVLKSPPNCDDDGPDGTDAQKMIDNTRFLRMDMDMMLSGAHNPVDATEYCAIKGDTAYKIITLVYNPSDTHSNLDDNPTLNKMISSFKFTNPSTAGASNWKTYRDEKFEVSYPPTWTYQKFSCNADGVAFCPIDTYGPLSCGVSCSVSGNSAPIYVMTDGEMTVASLSSPLNQHTINQYNDILDSMRSTFKFTSPSTTGLVTKVKIALLAQPAKDEDYKITKGCDLVRLVEREVPPTKAPLTAALNELFAKKEPWQYSESYPGNFISSQKNLFFDKVTIENGVAKVYLTGSVSLGGVCDDPRLSVQLNETAMQFSTVRSVEIFINGKLWTTPTGKGV